MFITAPRASSMDRSPYGRFWFEPVGMLSRSGIRVTPGSALALPTVFACVQVLAKALAVMPFCLYQPKVGGGRRKNVKHWLYRLIARAPNRFQTPYEWRLMLQGHLVLRGNAFCQITANGRGEITELLPLHPDRMTVELLPDGLNYRYRYLDQNGTPIYYSRGEIWHLRGLSNDGFVGISPIEAAREIVGEGLAMQSYSSRFFANDAQPGGGWIEAPNKFPTKEARGVFREDWQAMQGGANRGKIAVLEGGMKFHEVGLNNKDSQFIEARGLNAKQIPQVFGVPPHKVQILDNATFTNIESQSIEFWTDTMLPYAELWESSIEYFLLGEDEPLGLDPEFDMSRMMRGDAAARTAYYTGGINSGWLTRNEARDMEGLDPIDGLDEPLRPLNMVEESEHPDEIAEGDGGADDRTSPDDTGDDASARRSRHRSVRRAAKHRAGRVEAMRLASMDSAQARVSSLLRANASRLARRIADRKPVGADVIAEAMAVSLEQAQSWLDAGQPDEEKAIAASLLALAGVLPQPDQQAQALNRIAGAIAASPAPVVNVAPAAVHVAAPVVNNHLPEQAAAVVNVTTPVPQVSVNVEPAAVTIQAAEPPVVNVNIEPAQVHVTNEVATPFVNVNVPAAEPPMAQKPWPTRTTIKKRDDQGRADVIDTEPIG